MKDINIKIWPELSGFFSSLIPLPRVKSSRLNDVNIDLSNIRQVNATGLAVLLIELLKIMNEAQQLRKWNISYPDDWEVKLLMAKLGFFSVLEEYVLERDLFWPSNSFSKECYISTDKLTSSLPVYVLNFNNKDGRRGCIEEFLDWLFNVFSDLESKYVFKANKLIPILHEMAKNSADHTNGNAILGIDTFTDALTNDIKICFLFGDLGEGINQSIARFIAKDPSFSHKHKHLSLSDAYHYALGPGYTTKPGSGTNRGLGMAIIYDMAKSINLHLSVFDANSRGILSQAKNKTHKELRKVFYNVGKNVGFYYYGELKLTKR